MKDYRISGIWKDNRGVISHYAFHTVKDGVWSRAEKVSKAEAIRRIEEQGANAVTWVWSYTDCDWKKGETVYVVQGDTGKYLRTEPDDRMKDNLGHLIELDWVAA
jgi:hypothetical protein